MVRAAAAFAGVFAGVFVVLLVAVGQLGKIDGQTLVVALALSVGAAAVAAWRRRA